MANNKEIIKLKKRIEELEAPDYSIGDVVAYYEHGCSYYALVFDIGTTFFGSRPFILIGYVDLNTCTINYKRIYIYETNNKPMIRLKR